MVIQVTQGDIDRGVPNNPRGCPIARALNRSLKVADVLVDVGGINFLLGDCGLDGDGEDLEYVSVANLPQVSRFINAFDYNEEVQPFEFELDIPCVAAQATCSR